jgi:L-lactate dehydrogenase (cytochrome)
VQGILHADGELATARAARSIGVPMVLSTLSSHSIEAVGRELGETPKWFQLYCPRDRDLAKSLIRRAESAGYTALVITLDSPYLGWREVDLQRRFNPFLVGEGLTNYFSDPVFLSGLRAAPEVDLASALRHWLAMGTNPEFAWKDLRWLRQATRLPVLLKGILHPDDAREALRHGIDGLIVSNHGGRQLNGAIAALKALEVIADRFGRRTTVLFDSGIRRGPDIFKALALGARAVLVGRPYCYGLALGGETGVAEVLRNLLADFDLTMALAGCASIEQITRAMLARSGGAFKGPAVRDR